MQCNTYHRWVFQGAMVNQWGSYETDDLTYAPNGNGDVLKLYSFENFDKFDSLWIMGATQVQVSHTYIHTYIHTYVHTFVRA